MMSDTEKKRGKKWKFKRNVKITLLLHNSDMRKKEKSNRKEDLTKKILSNKNLIMLTLCLISYLFHLL